MFPARKRRSSDLRLRVELSEHMRLIRQTSGLTQREVAHRMGRPRQVVCHLENADDWTVAIFLLWAYALDRKVTYSLAKLPPLDSDPLAIAELDLYRLNQHLNQIWDARKLDSFRLWSNITFSEVQKMVRDLGGALKIELTRTT